MDPQTGQIYTENEIDALPQEIKDRLISGSLEELELLAALVKEHGPPDEIIPAKADVEKYEAWKRQSELYASFNRLNEVAEKAAITMADIPKQLGAATPITSKEKAQRRAKSKVSRKNRRINRARR